MTIEEAIKYYIIQKTYKICCPQTNYEIYWSDSDKRYSVNGKLFENINKAINYFIKRTSHGRLSRTEKEVESGIAGPLD